MYLDPKCVPGSMCIWDLEECREVEVPYVLLAITPVLGEDRSDLTKGNLASHAGPETGGRDVQEAMYRRRCTGGDMT